MELTVHTYGHIDAMYYVLNGIAMLMNHNFADKLIKTITIVMTAYYGLKMAYAGSSGNYKQYITKIGAMVLLINGALITRADMFIVDHVSKKKEVVSNLPVGFALPIGMLEAFGCMLTGGFEQAFTAVGTTRYSDYGMVFGARLVQDARNWRIKTPEFAENMDVFLRRCVIRDAMIGYNYTANDLLTTDDIWKLASEKAGTLRRVSMRKGKDWDLVTCKEAANYYIAPAFMSEFEALKRRKSATEFASANNGDRYQPRNNQLINNFLGKNIQLVFGSYLGVNKSAEELIRQQLIINSLSDIGDEYGQTRASMQQESSWKIAGDLADTYLPILLSVIKGMIYASFMFMVPLMLMSGGGAKYVSYLTVVASLQLWPALNAILNMFIDVYSSHSLAGIADHIVSFATFSEIGNYADKIVAVASGLQVSIPFLAFAIVQGGVGGFVHLAGNIIGATQAAAGNVASEIVTGNRSLDNMSLGNMQVAMQQGFKTDWNQAYASGASSYQHMDGTMEKVVGSGETIFQSGAGITMSGGGTKFNVREYASAQIAENLTNAQSLMSSDQRAYNEAEQATFDRTAGLVSSLAQRESRGETIDYSQAGENGQSLQQAVNQTRMLHEKYGYGWRQAAEGSLKTSASASTPLKGLTGIGVSGSAEASVGASNSSDQAFGDDKLLNRENQTKVDYNSVVKAAMNDQFAKSNNIDTTYSSDIRRTYHEQQALEKQLAVRAEQVENYNTALAQIQSKDATYEQDMYHQLEQGVAKAYGVSTKDAHNMIENNDPRVNGIRQRMISDEVSRYVGSDMAAGRERLSNENNERALDNFTSQHEGKIQRDHTHDVKEQAQQIGLDVNNNDFVKGDDLETKAKSLITNNQKKIEEEKVQNEKAESDLHNKVVDLDSNRISPALGIGGPINPSTIKENNKGNAINVNKCFDTPSEPKQAGIQIMNIEENIKKVK